MKYIEAHKPVVVCECGVVMQPTSNEVCYENLYYTTSFEVKSRIRVMCPKCKTWIVVKDASENCYTNAIKEGDK